MTSEQALSRLIDRFSALGWDRGQEVAIDIVRQVRESDAASSVATIASQVPRRFLNANGVTRGEVVREIEHALHGVVIEPYHVGNRVVLHVHGDGAKVTIGGQTVMSKTITINNSGQFAGNIDSPEGKVEIGQQQQAKIDNSLAELMRHSNDPEVQEILALPISEQEKKSRLGQWFAKAANVGLDVATDFAAKMIGELVRPR
jgi:hypothetical protein